MLRAFACLLGPETRGAAHIELAFSVPLLLLAGLGTVQWAEAFYVRNQIQTLAGIVADNASRMRQGTNLGAEAVSESDINEVLTGAALQGQSINLNSDGRVIISSLERNANGGQWIHWQRCIGALRYPSAYRAGLGVTDRRFPGAKVASETLKASTGQSIMIVEVVVDHVPTVSIPVLGQGPKRFTGIAAMETRGDRALDSITSDAPPSKCT